MFMVKSMVQCADELKHKATLKFSKKIHCRPKLSNLASEITIPQADYIFSGSCRLKIFRRPIRGLFSRPDKSF